MASAAKPSPQAAADLFIERARAVGAEVIRIDRGSLVPTITQHIASLGVKSVALWNDELLEGISDALRQADIEVIENAAAAGAGLTAVDFAVAETGTLVLTTSRERPRGPSLLPPFHLAVLPEDRIVGSLFDLIPRLLELPSALTFITGPSRSADIELTPVQGAHGPIAVRIFLCTDIKGR